uniref:Uncharacterized protein n=1 Tax=Coccidioides posadasii RMSCC 3488 TaxID=454284 RepID=A0A0J6FJB0_COCPO|nr:hypothetical protein CPAG_05810 [Coccidioides posadasii RMSCC 3488]
MAQGIRGRRCWRSEARGACIANTRAGVLLIIVQRGNAARASTLVVVVSCAMLMRRLVSERKKVVRSRIAEERQERQRSWGDAPGILVGNRGPLNTVAKHCANGGKLAGRTTKQGLFNVQNAME